MAKISSYCPLYLATRNPFPDIDTSHRENYCSQMFKKAVKFLQDKYSKESQHLVRLQHAKQNFRQNDVYRHIFEILVWPILNIPFNFTNSLMLDLFQILQKVNDFRSKWKDPIRNAVLQEYGLRAKVQADPAVPDEVRDMVSALRDKLSYTYTVRWIFSLISHSQIFFISPGTRRRQVDTRYRGSLSQSPNTWKKHRRTSFGSTCLNVTRRTWSLGNSSPFPSSPSFTLWSVALDPYYLPFHDNIFL